MVRYVSDLWWKVQCAFLCDMRVDPIIRQLRCPTLLEGIPVVLWCLFHWYKRGRIARFRAAFRRRLFDLHMSGIFLRDVQ